MGGSEFAIANPADSEFDLTLADAQVQRLIHERTALYRLAIPADKRA